jgi:hypothetical protein
MAIFLWGMEFIKPNGMAIIVSGGVKMYQKWRLALFQQRYENSHRL